MKTLKEFDYDLWAIEENGRKRYFARIKATGEEAEVSLEVMRLLLRQEKQMELPGMVLLEQIKTIDKRRVRKYLGRMTRQQMDEIGEAIEEALGLYVPEEMEAP